MFRWQHPPPLASVLAICDAAWMTCPQLPLQVLGVSGLTDHWKTLDPGERGVKVDSLHVGGLIERVSVVGLSGRFLTLTRRRGGSVADQRFQLCDRREDLLPSSRRFIMCHSLVFPA